MPGRHVVDEHYIDKHNKVHATIAAPTEYAHKLKYFAKNLRGGILIHFTPDDTNIKITPDELLKSFNIFYYSESNDILQAENPLTILNYAKEKHKIDTLEFWDTCNGYEFPIIDTTKNDCVANIQCYQTNREHTNEKTTHNNDGVTFTTKASYTMDKALYQEILDNGHTENDLLEYFENYFNDDNNINTHDLWDLFLSPNK